MQISERDAIRLLCKPLIFGDALQIAAIKALAAREEILEKGLYRVQVEIEGSYHVDVEAESVEAAEEIVRGDIDLSGADITCRAKRLTV